MYFYLSEHAGFEMEHFHSVVLPFLFSKVMGGSEKDLRTSASSTTTLLQVKTPQC